MVSTSLELFASVLWITQFYNFNYSWLWILASGTLTLFSPRETSGSLSRILILPSLVKLPSAIVGKQKHVCMLVQKYSPRSCLHVSVGVGYAGHPDFQTILLNFLKSFDVGLGRYGML